MCSQCYLLYSRTLKNIQSLACSHPYIFNVRSVGQQDRCLSYNILVCIPIHFSFLVSPKKTVQRIQLDIIEQIVL